ncbi:MAG: GNAT family N-acetyltransferase, partial [Planctomycetota bacterium]|nr:GNAT family N-acetyltransferase [Planctomycetota bacterium]
WKSQQCTQTDSIDVFGVEWSRQLMRNLLETNLSEFGGVLSTLRANGRLIAAHMGMRSDKIWHYWFPSYDHGFAQYSPGLVLLLRMAEAAQALGVSAIDLGKGDSFYKGRLANAEVALLEGRIEVPAIATSLRAMWRAAERWTDSGPTGRIIGAPIRAWRRWERSRKYK